MKTITANLSVIDVIKSNDRFNYELGYVVNGSFGAVNGNLASLPNAFDSDTEFQKGDIVSISCSGIEPVCAAGKFGVVFEQPEIIGKCQTVKTVSSTGSIIRDADHNGILKASDSVLSDLASNGIIKRAVPRNAAVEMTGPVAKVDLTFPLYKDAEQQVVYGVVYEPFDGTNSDTQGDYATAEEIEKACDTFNDEYNRAGLMHSKILNKNQAKILQSYIAPADFSVAGQTIKKGSWVIKTKVEDRDLWDMIKKGELTGYSMGGTGKSSDFMKSDSYKNITKKCLYDMVINEVSLVDKGANKKRFFLMKKDNTVTKEELIEALASEELITKISDKVSEKITKSMELKKAEADAAQAAADKAAADEAAKAAGEKKDVQWYIDNPEAEVPEDMIAAVVEALGKK